MNKEFRVGVIGLRMGERHAKGVVATEGATLAAICDVNTETLNKVGDELNCAARYTDYREMLKNEKLDAVIIASPDQLHKEMVYAAIEADLHILCEKPLALTREDCQEIVDAVKKSTKKFMVGQICRFTPGFVKAKELIDAGEIGELTFVESEYAHDYAKIYAEGTWRSDPARNGVVGGGCHAVDLLRWITDSDPEEIMAYGTHKTFADVTPYDDTHVAIMKFPNGVIGKVFVSISCKRDYTMRSVFYGTKGTIITDNTSPSMTLFKDFNEQGEDTHSKPITIEIDINNHNAEGEFRHFFDLVINDKPIDTTVIEGANTIAACFAVMDSTRSGRPEAPKYFK